MQPGGRTPSSILRKRAADEQNQRRRSLRAKGGRRVSFAPDDELETMHLFQKDMNSPISQDTQPLAEVQNHMPHHHHQQQLHYADMMDNGWQKLPAQQFDQAQNQYMMQSPGLSPMSMELTNDTLQQQAAGFVPFAGNENGSLIFNGYGAPAAKDNTHNITDNVPALSTLVEEDEDELYNDTDGTAMELTGNTTAHSTSPGSEKSKRNKSAAASPAQPSPAVATRSSSGRSRKQSAVEPAAATPPAPLVSPRRRNGRRSSTGSRAGGDAPLATDAGLQTPPTGAAAAADQQQHGRPQFAPSMDPTPSPLRRITRSMSSPLDPSPLPGLTDILEAGGASRRSRRSTLNRYADQQNKWGFVPGEEDTMNIDLDLPGAGGLGEATLHHVYAESAGTGELTLAVRQGQLAVSGAAAAAPAGRAGGRRRSSIGRGRVSLAQEVIPEESATPAQSKHAEEEEEAAASPAAVTPAAPTGAEFTEDMAISPDLGPGLLGQQQTADYDATPPISPLMAAGPAAAAMQEADGLTTNLLLDDRDIGGWGHVALLPHTTGRGSVGSNVPAMHMRGGGHTTQLLADTTTAGQPPLFLRNSAAAGSGCAAERAAPAAPYEDCTTKLLADSTAASACGVMGLFAVPRAARLGGTIAGGAPVVEPGALQVQQQQQAYTSPELTGSDGGSGRQKMAHRPFGSPAVPAFGLAAVPAHQPGDARAAEAGAQEHEHSTGSDWQTHQEQVTPAMKHVQLQQQAASPAGAEPTSEPTLELACAASQGGQTNALEDATLEDFAVPPDLAGGAERPITMPFSGPLCSLGNDNGAPGSVARTPGGSLRQAQAITFTDFCQIVDMQFLTHIRRGTSINVMDFQPSSVPQDLTHALQLLAVTSCEVAVLEGAMHQLQSEMHNKRRDAYEQEDKLGAENPSIFATVQTARHTQLEQAKHCLVLLKKICRSETACSWKQLRQAMEQELADRLAQQQADLQEQLAFVQGKLQKAQQQREYAKAFHADVLKKLAHEEAAQQEATAARSRLSLLRNRLAELRTLNADRKQHAKELQAEVQVLRARCAETQTEQAVLLAKREQLAAVMATTPKPAHSSQVYSRLCSATERLELLAGLQGWQLAAVGSNEWLVSFSNKAGIRLSLATEGTASGKLELTCARTATGLAAGGCCDVGLQLVQALIGAMQPRYSFCVPTSQLPLAFSKAELALRRAVKLSEQCRSLFEWQPLLTAVQVTGTAAESSSTEDIGQCWLCITFIAVEQELKVNVLLSLAGLLEGSNNAGPNGAGVASKVEVVISPNCVKAKAAQHQLGTVVHAALTGLSSKSNLLECVVVETSNCLLAL